MKMMTLLTTTLLASALTSMAVLAQPGMGGPGGGWNGWIWNSGNVAGWQLMTPEERTAHQNKMRSMTSYDECIAYVGQERQLMEQRAKEQGATLPAPRANACDQMKARGLIK